MKALFYFLFIFFPLSRVMAQTLTEDAQGKSSIAFGGSSLNFDIAEAALSANFSNFRNLAIGRPASTIWGISASGSNSEGTAALFSGGKFQPAARFGGFIGRRIKLPGSLRAASTALDDVFNDPNYKHLEALKEQYWDAADDVINNSSLSNNDKINLKKTVKNAIGFNRKPDKPADVDSRIAAIASHPMVIVDIRTAIAAIDLSNNVSAIPNGLNNQLAALNATIPGKKAALFAAHANNPKRQILSYYLAGGINSSTFKLYDASLTGDIAARFTKTPYKGIYLDLGLNYSLGANWLLGASIGYERANTFDQLTQIELTARTTDNSGNQQIISEKKYSGYAGNFKLYNQANIRTDALYFSQLGGQDSEYRLAWNIIYLRGMLSDDHSISKNTLTIGTSVNFFKIEDGSLLGGFYLQADDAFNAQDAPTNLYKRLTFGIVAKYAFRTILNGF